MFKKIAFAFRTNMILGLALITPIVITAWLCKFLFNNITEPIKRNFFDFATERQEFVLRLIALVVVLCCLYLIGLLARNIIGKSLYRLSDTIMVRIPFIKDIYRFFRQVSESVLTYQQTFFREVVAIEYPRKGLHSIAFVTSRLPDDLASKMIAGWQPGTDCVCLFVPTTPNPTSGFFIMSRRADVTVVDIPVSEAVKLVMSTGCVLPTDADQSSGNGILDKIQMWMDGPQPEESPAALEEKTPETKSA